MDEQRRVLEMVAAGDLTVEDAQRLLDALQEGAEQPHVTRTHRTFVVEGARHGAFEDHLLDPDVRKLVTSHLKQSLRHRFRTHGHRAARSAIDEIVSLRSMGIRPEYVKEMKEILEEDLSTDEVVALHEEGVAPEFAREMRQILIDVSGDDLVRFVSEGVAPAYAREMKTILVDVSGDDLVTFVCEGIAPKYAREMKRIFGELSPDDLVALANEGVKPEEVVKMADAGVINIDVRKVIRRATGEDDE